MSPTLRCTTLCLVALLVTTLWSPARAEVPATVTFTARFVDQGVPASGPLPITLALYRNASGGASVFAEAHAATAVDGLVSLAMGDQERLDDAVLAGPLFLEVTVGGTVLSPRLPIRSVPYALRAARAETLGELGPDDVQRRVTQACPAGSSIRAIAANGAVTCQADTDTNTTYSASCGANQFVRSLSTSGTATCGGLSSTSVTVTAIPGQTVNLPLGSRTLCMLTTVQAGDGPLSRCALTENSGNWTFTAQSSLSPSGTVVTCVARCL
jgi:hypothetical protein